MRISEHTILVVTEIVRDSVAMNNAALAGDFDEARFRASLIVSKADAAGQIDVALAAAYIVDRLGPVGSEPRDGYAAGMLRVADELSKTIFESL